MNDTQQVLLTNMTRLRRARGLTQGELGEQIHYSDKTISKWENGDTCPNIEAVSKLAKFYGVRVDDLLDPDFAPETMQTDGEDVKQTKNRVYSKIVITLLAVLVVWTVAIIAFLYTSLLFNQPRAWLAFVDALPCSCIIVVVFNSLWGKPRWNYIVLTVLLWTLLTSFYLHLLSYNIWVLYLLGVPIQAAIILWSQLKIVPRPNAAHKKKHT